MRSPCRVVGQSLKSFLGCLFLSLGSFRRAAPRAVGSRSRVGLLARPSAAGRRRRASAGQLWPRACRFVWWVPHPPGAAFEARLAAGATGPARVDSRKQNAMQKLSALS